MVAATALLLTFPLAEVTAQALETGGHVKSLNVYFEEAPSGATPEGEISSNSLRFDLQGDMPQTGRWRFSLDNQLLYTNPPGFVSLPSSSTNRAVDLEKSWGEGERFADRLIVDRLNIEGSAGGMDWIVGRQAVGFGRMSIFSPLDVVAPFAPDALETDVRPGVDAARLMRYFGLGGHVGATAVIGDKPSNRTFLATASHNVAGIDLVGLGGSLRHRETAGAGIAGSLGGLGLKAEAAHYNGKKGDFHDSFAIAAAEAWYRFDSGLIMLLEYLYNGAGSSDPADYPLVAESATHGEGLSFLLGRHYLMAAPSYEPHPLATLSTLLIWNLEDDSFLLRPLADLSLSDAADLELFWTFNSGTGAAAGPLPGTQLPRSEFGLAGDSGGAFVKFFF